ncbi:NAD(P)/FAD-dependent oxidoreductase [Marinilactibacillus kalidii]|uniref:NAD(P)/FAD-dependent oxidoreductase n=1 Tax=Marinilactibacillus kalidii TaxID=2820274 RepID=UPI001ABEB1E0|nr:NAD(P)/FAD-dependent oxidoreductase [Marinilactibacillus kalidii]
MKIDNLVTIIGAGAAGIGTAVVLKRLGIKDILVIDKGEVGQSFLDWNDKTRFISPSFNTNGFGFPDMNAITPDTSPGYYAEEEHLSGVSYAAYLKEVTQFFDVSVITKETVLKIEQHESGYILTGEKQQYKTKYVIMALGDVSYPYLGNIRGTENSILYVDLKDYSQFNTNSQQAIIGGNESGFDAAINLAKRNIRSTIYTRTAGIDSDSSDPSQSLSLYTKSRYREVSDYIRIHTGVEISEIHHSDDAYFLSTSDGEVFEHTQKPILATGFSVSQSPILKPFFDLDRHRILLTEQDESTIYHNIFMVGSQVEHEGVILCFIYKYRQRFAYIANIIAEREKIPVDPLVLQLYKDYQMFLDDLSCCDTDCLC